MYNFGKDLNIPECLLDEPVDHCIKGQIVELPFEILWAKASEGMDIKILMHFQKGFGPMMM